MEKNTKFCRREKKNKRIERRRATIFIFLMFTMALFMLSFASAADWMDKKVYVQDETTNQYGRIEIYSSFFLGIGYGEKLQDFELIENVGSVVEGYAIGYSTLYSEGMLFRGFTFSFSDRGTFLHIASLVYNHTIYLRYFLYALLVS
jgi:hypothetical protein